MYCKYCGSVIDDNCTFCSKCGRLLVEDRNNNSALPQMDNAKNDGLIDAKRIVWRKPFPVVGLQVLIIMILITNVVYAIYSISHGEEHTTIDHESRNEYYSLSGHHMRSEMECVHIWDPIHLYKYLAVNNSKIRYSHHDGNYWSISSAHSRSEIEYLFREYEARIIFLVIIPTLLIILIVILWMKSIRFPTTADGIPGDYCDRIEDYSLTGFRKKKYVIYEKNGRYGVLDVANYRIAVSEQYDSIQWIKENESCRVVIDGVTDTLMVEEQDDYLVETEFTKLKNKTINSGRSDIALLGIAVMFGLALFLIIITTISIITQDETSDNVRAYCFAASLILIIIGFAIAETTKK